MKKIFKYILFLSLPIFIISVFFLALENDNQYTTENLVGQKIKNFELPALNNGRLINEESLTQNNYTLINFWASWCSPCRDEHPILVKLNADEENLKIIGVNFKDKKDHALQFLNELGNPYHELTRDKLGKQSVNFGVYGIPESILINKDLVIIEKFIGPISKKEYKLIKSIVRK